jgi:hypothetical protein
MAISQRATKSRWQSGTQSFTKKHLYHYLNTIFLVRSDLFIKLFKTAIAQSDTKDTQSFTKNNPIIKNTPEILSTSSIPIVESNNPVNSNKPNFVALSDFFEQLCEIAVTQKNPPQLKSTYYE